MTPGPIVAAVVAGPVGRLAARIDARLLIFVGGAVWAAGIGGYLLLAGSEPDFLGGWLPATIVAGIGAGISFPTISGVAVADAPGERFATATSITGVARQIGAAIGVAVLIAVIGTPATALDDFQSGWVLAMGIFLGLALCAPALGAVTRRRGRRRRRRAGPSGSEALRGAPRIVGRLRAPMRERRMLPGIEGNGSIAGFLERGADARGRTAGCARAAGRDRVRGAGPRRRRRLLRGRSGGQPVRGRRRAAGGGRHGMVSRSSSGCSTPATCSASWRSSRASRGRRRCALAGTRRSCGSAATTSARS